MNLVAILLCCQIIPLSGAYQGGRDILALWILFPSSTYVWFWTALKTSWIPWVSNVPCNPAGPTDRSLSGPFECNSGHRDSACEASQSTFHLPNPVIGYLLDWSALPIGHTLETGFVCARVYWGSMFTLFVLILLVDCGNKLDCVRLFI